ncbi:hypothetical protein R1flu_002739 [Riccia fluitans]|uniref:Reverse transcriptase Ty1/copia-type domain-containing protein n=1 Tax=Riccia fluitans TaxID=41844 RepID=A0ABD1YAS6_9MARC
MSEKGMEVLRKQNLLFALKSSKQEFCELCVFGKHKRSAFNVRIHRSIEILESTHNGVWSKSPIPSHSGKEFYVSFIDDYLRYVWVYYLQHKSEVFATFVKWRAKWRLKLERKDVSFNETKSLKEVEKAQAPNIDKGESHPFGVEGEIIHDIDHDMPQGDISTIVEDVLESEEHVEEHEGVGRPMDRPRHDDHLESSMRRSSRVKSALERYGVWFLSDQVDEHDNEGDVYTLITEEGKTSSFEEAQNSVEKVEWTVAMWKEMKFLNDNKTWELVELPKGKQVIACRWVYKRKEGSGQVKRSSRLDEMDVVTTFFYAVLDEVIFMRQPPSFARKGHESLVCKLLKSLYGLKQSPRQ